MSLLLVLQQSMRMPQALAYAASRDDQDKVIVTADLEVVGGMELPPRTTVVTLQDQGGSSSDAAAYGSAIRRAERWAKGGSALGAKVGRWMRSSEWRLRYADRLRLIVEHGRARRAPVDHGLLLAAIRSVAASDDIEEIVLFDLLDLPPILDFAIDNRTTVKVR